jgi:hypothetical protein
MTMVIGALALLGILLLGANTSLLESTADQDNSEFGVTAISLANSLVDEALGKKFDRASLGGAIGSLSQLTSPDSLGPDGSEHYRGVQDFDDFDDFNNIFLVYKSNVPSDTAHTPGSNWEQIVPGLRAKYFVRAKVEYVQENNLDFATSSKTWYKRITVIVSSPSYDDSLAIPAVMSYWN